MARRPLKERLEPETLKNFNEQQIRVNFRPDKGLFYLIQQTTNQSTEDIIMFFYEFGKKVAYDGILNMTGSEIRKEIHDFVPNTAIPFKMLVKGGRCRGTWTNGKWVETHHYNVDCEVGFPDKPSYFDTKDLDEIMMEKILLGADSTTMPPFERPSVRTPRMYKDLIEEVLQKRANHGTTDSDSGHTRKTRSSGEDPT